MSPSIIYVPTDCECKYRHKFSLVKLLNLAVDSETIKTIIFSSHVMSLKVNAFTPSSLILLRFERWSMFTLELFASTLKDIQPC
jgi:hypothetical protein